MVKFFKISPNADFSSKTLMSYNSARSGRHLMTLSLEHPNYINIYDKRIYSLYVGELIEVNVEGLDGVDKLEVFKYLLEQQ
jgi:hypothetical protein